MDMTHFKFFTSCILAFLIKTFLKNVYQEMVLKNIFDIKYAVASYVSFYFIVIILSIYFLKSVVCMHNAENYQTVLIVL